MKNGVLDVECMRVPYADRAAVVLIAGADDVGKLFDFREVTYEQISECVGRIVDEIGAIRKDVEDVVKSLRKEVNAVRLAYRFCNTVAQDGIEYGIGLFKVEGLSNINRSLQIICDALDDKLGSTYINIGKLQYRVLLADASKIDFGIDDYDKSSIVLNRNDMENCIYALDSIGTSFVVRNIIELEALENKLVSDGIYAILRQSVIGSGMNDNKNSAHYFSQGQLSDMLLNIKTKLMETCRQVLVNTGV